MNDQITFFFALHFGPHNFLVPLGNHDLDESDLVFGYKQCLNATSDCGNLPGCSAYLWKLDNKVVWHFHCVVEIVKYLGKFPLI